MSIMLTARSIQQRFNFYSKLKLKFINDKILKLHLVHKGANTSQLLVLAFLFEVLYLF